MSERLASVIGPGSLRTIGQIFIIAFSVLLALAADAWWANHVRDGQERDLLEALTGEFEANGRELAATGEVHERILDHALRLLEAGATDVTSDSVFAESLLFLVQNTRTDVNNGVLAGYLRSADPALLGDAALRADLAEWPATLDELWQQEDRHTSLIDDQIVPYIVRQGELGVTFRTSAIWEGLRTDEIRALREAAIRRGGNVALLDDPEFRNLVTWKVRAERDILLKHRRVTETHARILGMLRAQLDQS